MKDIRSLSKEELLAWLNDENTEKEDLIKMVGDLLDTSEKLKADLEKANAQIRLQQIKLDELIAKYEDKVEQLRRKQIEQFIPSSEKLKKEDLVINEAEVLEEKKKRKPYKKQSEQFIEDLKKLYHYEDIILDFDFDGHGISRDDVKPFGEDETYKLEYHPASFEVKRYVRPKYKDNEHVYEASFDDDPFPHSPLTPSLAANIIEMKYVLGVPLYRYSKYLIQNGINISDITLSSYVSKSTNLLEPIYEKLCDTLFHNQFNVLHIDETPLQVIDSDKSTGYIFVYASSFWDRPVYIYDFSASRATDQTKQFLKDYKGAVIVDGYSGYDCLKDMGITIQRCMVHARRYFSDVIKALPEAEQKDSPAYEVIKKMSKLFEYEDSFKRNRLTADRIQRERNSSHYQKAIKKLDRCIDSIDAKGNHLLSKAVNYYHNQHDELYTYLSNGYVDLHNNLCERAVKPFVVSRKNFLFCKSINGAETTGKIFSIVQSARSNGLKSEKYIAYCLANINKIPIEDLMPYSPNLPKDIYITQKDIQE